MRLHPAIKFHLICGCKHAGAITAHLSHLIVSSVHTRTQMIATYLEAREEEVRERRERNERMRVREREKEREKGE